jgi:gluconokinase
MIVTLICYNPRMIVIVMGVAGSGKTTVGKGLADDLGWAFYDADDFHPPENVAKMAQGIALTDADRMPWLEALAALSRDVLAAGQSAVIACSALKRAYREVLRVDAIQVRFVYLKGDYALFLNRLRQREDHFMKPDMLRSQFDTLEAPRDALTVDADQTPEVITQNIKQQLDLS